jgi:hypothetical protein
MSIFTASGKRRTKRDKRTGVRHTAHGTRRWNTVITIWDAGCRNKAKGQRIKVKGGCWIKGQAFGAGHTAHGGGILSLRYGMLVAGTRLKDKG